MKVITKIGNTVIANGSILVPDTFSGRVVLSGGSVYWYKNGEKHRGNGPAVIWSNGTKKWYWKGDKIGNSSAVFGFTQEDFEEWKREHGY